jgi:hypothetical protein
MFWPLLGSRLKTPTAISYDDFTGLKVPGQKIFKLLK